MRAPYSRSKDVALALLVWSCSVCFAASAARQTAQRNQDTLAKSYLSSSEDLVRQLKTLFERWKAIPAAERATKSSPIKNEVDATVSNYVSSRLTASSRPSASGLQTEVSKALAVATWESVFGLSPEAAVEAWNSNRPKLAFLVQGTGNASDLYIAGFSVGYGNTFSVFIHGFGPVASANYGPVGTTGGELDGSTPKAEKSSLSTTMSFALWRGDSTLAVQTVLQALLSIHSMASSCVQFGRSPQCLVRQ
jgi:hypothetical protein